MVSFTSLWLKFCTDNFYSSFESKYFSLLPIFKIGLPVFLFIVGVVFKFWIYIVQFGRLHMWPSSNWNVAGQNWDVSHYISISQCCSWKNCQVHVLQYFLLLVWFSFSLLMVSFAWQKSTILQKPIVLLFSFMIIALCVQTIIYKIFYYIIF